MKVFRVLLLVIMGICLSLSLLVTGPALTAKYSLLDADFVIEHMERLDIAEVAEETVIDQIPEEASDFMGESLDTLLTDTIADLEDWLKEQAAEVIHVLYDFLEGDSDELTLTIDLSMVKAEFRQNLLMAVLDSPPPELAGATPEEIELAFNEHYQLIAAEIPSIVELSGTLLNQEAVDQITQARRYVLHFNLIFLVLIGFSLLLILLIILTHSSVRGSTRQLGITFLCIGGISLGGAFIARSAINGMLSGGDIPATLQSWAPEVVTDVLTPLGIYGIGLLVAGIALTVVSFVVKRGGGDDYDFYY